MHYFFMPSHDYHKPLQCLLHPSSFFNELNAIPLCCTSQDNKNVLLGTLIAPCTGPLQSYSATTWTVGTHELDELKIGMVCGTAVQQMENVYGPLLYIRYKCWVTNLASNLVQILLSLGSNPAPTVHDVGKRYGIQLEYT